MGGASNAALGLGSAAVIEDFEDMSLIAGLKIPLTNSSAGSYGPTNTLPDTFAPVTGDPFGNAFDTGVSDRTRVLLDTGNHLARAYARFSAWGDVTFQFEGGATQIGSSLQQMSHDANIYMNGDCTALSMTICR